MALLGKAALAMWWDIAPDVLADFEDWHAHEHFPERLSLPGFRRATRWRDASGGEGMFVMYELAAHDTLSSPEYLARLNAPSPWSTRLMPQHRNMVRSQCRVVATRGGSTALHALTLRLSPSGSAAGELEGYLTALVDELAFRPGLIGAHLLRLDAPAIATTTEQALRGHSDRHADWTFIACGYERAALAALAAAELAPARLLAQGVRSGIVEGLYTMACSATPGDVERDSTPRPAGIDRGC